MKPKELAFMILLTISGELSAEDKPCGLPRVENGRIAVYYYTFESFYFPMAVDQTLSFSCLAGYTTQSGKQEDRTTCTAGGWSPQPRCFKKCPRPALTNGHISEAKLLYSVHEKLRYTCASGYTTSSGLAEEEVQCLPEGWSSPPACREEQDTCLAPELLHGNYSTTQTAFRLGDKVRYRCNLGYYSTKGESEEEAECRSHGWLLPPSCTRRRTRCPPPPLPPHAKLKSIAASYHDGESVFIECQRSFRLRGLEVIRCVNGKWTDPPKCIEEADKIACDEPPEVQYGKALGTAETYFNGDRVAYSCQVGFNLRGPREITCELGTWTSPPRCVENFEICQYPPKITHGVIVGDVLPSYPTGAIVEYRCNEYYIMKGEKKSSCDHGMWSSPPLCLEPCEVSKADMESSNIELKWEYEGKVLHGDLIDFVCKPGFDLAPSSPPSGLSAQCRQGQVQYPLCMRKESKGKCGPPPRIEHGLILNLNLLNVSFESGSLVEYRCRTYYFLQGSLYAYCVDGVWTEPPVCLEPCNLSLEEMDRNNLLLKWHYDNRGLILHGEYTEFVCKINHYMTEVSAFATELRVMCDRGKLKYPRCVSRRK
ncbi:Coagulation factor XIII B chain [Myotis davidii]|uniref:Coagulation factor XIII B chain n=1 Tax=Myotis davidii TaxID=225400 RepID=L5LGY4_MYODS|nr:Coagulation factor XIII B chain [Myotis davidii]